MSLETHDVAVGQVRRWTGPRGRKQGPFRVTKVWGEMAEYVYLDHKRGDSVYGFAWTALRSSVATNSTIEASR